MKACISQLHESTSPLHFDNHLLLPIAEKKIGMCKVAKLKEARRIHTTFVSTVRRRPSSIAESCLYQASASRFHFTRLFGQFLSYSSAINMMCLRHSPTREMPQPGENLDPVSTHINCVEETLGKIVNGVNNMILFRHKCRVAINDRQSHGCHRPMKMSIPLRGFSEQVTSL
jgi:hypothetical protein